MQEKTKISEQGMNLFLSIFLSFYPRNFPKTFLPDLRATKWSLRKILLLLLLLLHNFKIEILCNIARKTQRGRKYENEFWKRETNGERMAKEYWKNNEGKRRNLNADGGKKNERDWTVKTENRKGKSGKPPLYNRGGEKKRKKRKKEKKGKEKIEKVIRAPSKSFIRNPGNLIRAEGKTQKQKGHRIRTVVGSQHVVICYRNVTMMFA